MNSKVKICGRIILYRYTYINLIIKIYKICVGSSSKSKVFINMYLKLQHFWTCNIEFTLFFYIKLDFVKINYIVGTYTILNFKFKWTLIRGNRNRICKLKCFRKRYKEVVNLSTFYCNFTTNYKSCQLSENLEHNPFNNLLLSAEEFRCRA